LRGFSPSNAKTQRRLSLPSSVLDKVFVINIFIGKYLITYALDWHQMRNPKRFERLKVPLTQFFLNFASLEIEMLIFLLKLSDKLK
jgi:hypothetical protein